MDSKDDVFHRRFLALFALVLVIGGGAYLWAVTFLPIPKDNIQIALMIVGFITGVAVAAPIAFYYGASQQASTPKPKEPENAETPAS